MKYHVNYLVLALTGYQNNYQVCDNITLKILIPYKVINDCNVLKSITDNKLYFAKIDYDEEGLVYYKPRSIMGFGNYNLNGILSKKEIIELEQELNNKYGLTSKENNSRKLIHKIRK